jgi:ribonuclease HI
VLELGWFPCHLAQETISLSYKLEFDATNNVEEYEALVLGMRAAKEIGIKEDRNIWRC